MVIFHYGHDSALSRVISFYLERCFKQINAPLLDVRGTWQHQRPVLHRADDATLRYQGLSFVDNRGNSSFQKFPSKPGRRSSNFILCPFVDTSLTLADGCVEECRRNMSAVAEALGEAAAARGTSGLNTRNNLC